MERKYWKEKSGKFVSPKMWEPSNVVTPIFLLWILQWLTWIWGWKFDFTSQDWVVIFMNCRKVCKKGSPFIKTLKIVFSHIIFPGLDTINQLFECPCESCDQTFNCIILWEQHQLWRHDSSHKYQCVKCGLLFTRAIKNHVRVGTARFFFIFCHFHRNIWRSKRTNFFWWQITILWNHWYSVFWTSVESAYGFWRQGGCTAPAQTDPQSQLWFHTLVWRGYH